MQHFDNKDSIFSGCVSDVVFAVDHSGSMGSENHPTITDFIKNIVNNVAIGPEYVQIGYGNFNFTLVNQMYLNTYSTATDINAALDGIG